MYRTFVPPSQRGKNLGLVLGDAAMNWCKSNKYSVKFSCEYLDKKYTNNPLYSDIIVADDE